MAVVKVKPTSPGRRAVVKVVHTHLHKGRPEASLLVQLGSWLTIALVCGSVFSVAARSSQTSKMFAVLWLTSW